MDVCNVRFNERSQKSFQSRRYDAQSKDSARRVSSTRKKKRKKKKKPRRGEGKGHFALTVGRIYLTVCATRRMCRLRGKNRGPIRKSGGPTGLSQKKTIKPSL